MRRLLRFLLLLGALAGAWPWPPPGCGSAWSPRCLWALPRRPRPRRRPAGPATPGAAGRSSRAARRRRPGRGLGHRSHLSRPARRGRHHHLRRPGRRRRPPRWPRPPGSPKSAPPAGSPRPPPSARADRPVPYLTAPDELAALLPGEPAYRVRQLREWLYRSPVPTAAAMTNLPAALRARLEPLWPFTVEAEQEGDRGPDGQVAHAGPRRRLLRGGAHGLPAAYHAVPLQPGRVRHGVHLLRHRPVRLRAAPGRPGRWWRRSPTPPPACGPGPCPGRPSAWATSSSWAWASRWPTTTTCGRRCAASSAEMGLSARAITVSTVGVVPGIRRLAAEPWPVTLALSLHAADDDTRAALVPLNRRYPIDEILAAARVFAESKGRRLTLEWTLIAGVNDTPEQARGLAAIAAELRAHANVIPLNPTPLTRYRAPSPERRPGLRGPGAARRRQRHLARHPGARHRCRLRPVALPPGGRDRAREVPSRGTPAGADEAAGRPPGRRTPRSRSPAPPRGEGRPHRRDARRGLALPRRSEPNHSRNTGVTVTIPGPQLCPRHFASSSSPSSCPSGWPCWSASPSSATGRATGARCWDGCSCPGSISAT